MELLTLTTGYNPMMMGGGMGMPGMGGMGDAFPGLYGPPGGF